MLLSYMSANPKPQLKISGSKPNAMRLLLGKVVCGPLKYFNAIKNQFPSLWYNTLYEPVMLP